MRYVGSVVKDVVTDTRTKPTRSHLFPQLSVPHCPTVYLCCRAPPGPPLRTRLWHYVSCRTSQERVCGCTTVVTVDNCGRGQVYRPLSVARLGALLAGADESRRWRLVAEFLEEYRWEPLDTRWGLLAAEPPGTGDERWDVFLAALAEHLAARDGRGARSWVESRSLQRWWFPFNTRAARVDALVHAPASFRRRGVYVAAQELGVA